MGNGDEYEGQWKDNMAEGEGVLRMQDGSVYTGHFSRGKEDGKGTIVSKDGVRFEGFFKQGKRMVLLSKQTVTEKIIRQGTFRSGRLLEEKK